METANNSSSTDAEVSSNQTDAAHPAAVTNGADEALLVDELLVEEVSIDGMCGVY